MPATPASTGYLLVNLGTPDSPSPRDVRPYLREFLSDPRVVDLPTAGRWLLLNAVVLPFRPRKSAEAYRAIWTPEGSPLLIHSRALAEKVQAVLGPGVPLALGMRYGKPSIPSALAELRAKGVERIVVLPLYPQSASSTTGSSLEAVYREVASWWDVPALSVVEPFFDHPAFIRAWEPVARPVLDALEPDHVLFSFHGLPERHLARSEGGHALCEGECPALEPAHRTCYRGQCYATARAIARHLSVPAERFSVSFQSRLGTTPWIRPYTDEVLVELAKKGVKRLAVFSPAFTADCLETLEEIGIRARETFLEHGGTDLRLVPSLNSHPAWVEAVVELLSPHLPAPQRDVITPGT